MLMNCEIITFSCLMITLYQQDCILEGNVTRHMINVNLQGNEVVVIITSQLPKDMDIMDNSLSACKIETFYLSSFLLLL